VSFIDKTGAFCLNVASSHIGSGSKYANGHFAGLPFYGAGLLGGFTDIFFIKLTFCDLLRLFCLLSDNSDVNSPLKTPSISVYGPDGNQRAHKFDMAASRT